MTLKELRQSSLLGCMACHALSQGTRAIVKKPGTTARRDSMISQDEHFGDVDRTNITAMGYEQTIDELELNYQIDPSFECPLNLGGWYVRCGCTDAVRYCRHKEYHLDIDVFTVPGSPSVFRGFPITQSHLIKSDSTSSDDTIQFISKAIARCGTSHSRTCTRNFEHSMAPIRMLRLDGDHAHLVELDVSPDLKYVCLAHRWATKKSWEGDEDFSTPYARSMRCSTSRSNLTQHKERIVIANLLPAYQDAISITKKLGLQYLWIDSLCIVQDDVHDKRTQIAQMGTIYRNSYLTIAADGLKDHTVSFFSSREWRWSAHEEVVPDLLGSNHTVYFRERPRHPYLGWNGLFDRAWCFQERLLSTRVVRFQAAEVIFECNEALTCECGNPPAGHQGPWEDLSMNAHLHDKVAFDYMINQTSNVSNSGSWHHLVNAYSRTYLTRESDRMNAFAGIVSLFQQRSLGNSQYLAGLWSHSLWEDLLWFVAYKNDMECQRSTPSEKVTIPSWSWMSIALGHHHIAYPKLKVQQTFPRLNSIFYEPQSVHLLLGDVAPGAYLDIEGQLTPARITNGIIEIGDFWSFALQLTSKTYWDPERRLYNDTDGAVALLRMAYLRDEPIVKEVFLILRAVVKSKSGTIDETQCYTRVGYLEISRDAGSSCYLEGLRIEEEYQNLRLY